MPDGRRPGLWKTLVAASRTTIDRIADGVDVLADGVEALADGLRTLGHREAPTPPPDPRFAGMDPAVAAYVAARDPVWFSFTAPGSPSVDAPSPPSDAGAAVPPFLPVPRSPGSGVTDPSAAAEASAPYIRSRRENLSAAELPGGRPPRRRRRIVVRRRREPSGTASSPHPADLPPDAASPSRRPVPGPDSGGAPLVKGPKGDEAATAHGERVASARDAPPASTSPAMLTPPESARATVKPASARATRPAAPYPGLASAVTFPARSAPVTDSDPARSGASDSAPWSPLEPPRAVSRSMPTAPFPSTPAVRPTPPPVREHGRPPASANAPARAGLTSAVRATPAPWPELPPPRWSEPGADAGGTLAWAGAGGSDVLVDEQRSM